MLGHVSRGQAKRAGRVPSGLALAGLIVGYIGIAGTVPVLGAIALPVFLNQREQAATLLMGNELREAAVAQEEVYADRLAYTTSMSDLSLGGYTVDATTPVTVLSAYTDRYCMKVTTENSDTTMYLDSYIGYPSESPCQ